MYPELDVERYQGVRPSFIHTLSELPRVPLEISSIFLLMPSLTWLPRGDGHPVVLVPGFLGDDLAYGLLRRYLRFMGYDCYTSGLGLNTGHVDHLTETLPLRLKEIYEKTGRTVSLVGHSLGGVFSRALAHDYPDLIRQVIMLGSPVRIGSNDTSGAMQGLHQIFHQVSDMTEAEMQQMEATVMEFPPETPVTAMYSKGDGVVHWSICCEKHEDATTQNIEIPGSHIGMGFNPAAYYVIADRLSQPEAAWERYTRRSFCRRH